MKKHLQETIRLDQAKHLLAAYAESTGQENNKLVTARNSAKPPIPRTIHPATAGDIVPYSQRGYDYVRALLDGGEYVNNAQSVAREGQDAFDALNSGKATIVPKSGSKASGSAPVQIASRTSGQQGSGGLGGMLAKLMQMVQQSHERNAEAVEQLTAKITSMRPGDVVGRGAEENPVAIGRANSTALQRNRDVRQDQQQRLGLRN